MNLKWDNPDIINKGTTLFIEIFKWVIYASGIGVVVGLSTGIFLRALGWSISTVGDYSYFFLLLPFALFATEWIVGRMAPEAHGHGTEQVIEAVHMRSGKINPMVVPIKAVATIITIAFGGSVGKEGPCAQIGAGISSAIADIFKLNDADRKKLVICGISAGFSAVFGTPIAGAIFGIEVVYVGTLLYEVMLASFIAGIISYQVATLLGVSYTYHFLNIIPPFNELFFFEVILAGVFFGICSILLIETFYRVEKISLKIPLKAPTRGLIGGIILVALALIFSTRYLGLGTGLIDSSLQGTLVDWYAFPLKIIIHGGHARIRRQRRRHYTDIRRRLDGRRAVRGGYRAERSDVCGHRPGQHAGGHDKNTHRFQHHGDRDVRGEHRALCSYRVYHQLYHHRIEERLSVTGIQPKKIHLGSLIK